MLDRMANSLRIPMASWAGLLGLLLVLPLAGAPKPPVQAAQFDPSDVYFQGYLAVRAAEQLEAAGDFSGAMEKLQSANQRFNAVSKYYPDWKKDMVGGRTAKTMETLDRVRPLADAQMRKNQNTVAELEGGVKKSGRALEPAEEIVPPTRILEADPLTARRLEEAQAEVKRLQKLVGANKAESAATRQQLAIKQADAAAARQQLAVNQADAAVTRQQLAANQADAAAARKQLAANQADAATARQQLAAKQADAETARQQLAAKASEGSRDNARLQDTERLNNDLQTQLKAAETNVESLRARLAAAPMEKDMKALNQRIETLEQERTAMGMALTQSRGAHTEALSRIATLEADLKVMQQKRADLDRDLKAERKVSSSVVAGQRRQLEALEKDLKRKDLELGKANERITGLISELQESRDAFTQLRTERDALLLERDQMGAILKLNEAGRIQDLIEQNMSLAKNLREANEKVDRLDRESNADKDAITTAMRDLAIAKSQINRLHQDKREQDKRLAELENRLKAEEQALAKGQAAADPAEIEVLRDIIRRQLLVQERRRQARDLLIEAAKDLGAKDERLAPAIELFDAKELALTPEEQKLIANNQVDGEFVSPFARDRATVGHATAELNRDISVFERTAEKSYVAGHLLPTRELYQMILEQHPGHTPSLCKLGVVHLRLKDPSAAVDTFRRAVELDTDNPYAYRMLGFALMELKDLPAAEQAARHAVDLAPNDAKSQCLLATLCYRLGRAGEAESYFKAAIAADPVPSEPYYNLALICSRNRRMEDARNFYQQALERGALPNTALEETLDQP